jgi:hypothetical protein
MNDKKVLGCLSDIFSAGKKVFESNKGYDTSLFAKEPSEEEKQCMLRYDVYSDYLAKRVPLYMTYVMAVGKLIQVGGYKGYVSTCFSKVNLIPNDGDPIAIDIAMKEGMEEVKKHMGTEVKILDEQKDHHLMVEVTGLPSDKLDEMCKTNKVVNSVGVRDLRASLAVGNITPQTKPEVSKAQTALLAAGSGVPVFVTSFTHVDGKVVVGERTMSNLNCGNVEAMGFDYHKLSSSKAKLREVSRSIQCDRTSWDPDIALKDLHQDAKDNNYVSGRQYLLSSTWFDDKLGVAEKNLLSRCKYKYVGKAAGFWNWIATMDNGDVCHSVDEIFLFVKLIPKLYKICILMGIRRKVWEENAKDFLGIVLSKYGMSPKLNLIYSIMGHLLEDHVTVVSMKYKQLPGVSKDILDMFFEPGADDMKKEVIEVEQLEDLADIFGGVSKIKLDPQKELQSKVIKNDDKSGSLGVNGSQDLQNNLDKSESIVIKSGVNEERKIWDYDSLFDTLFSKTVESDPWYIDDDLVVDLSQGIWNEDLMFYMFKCFIGEFVDDYEWQGVTKVKLTPQGFVVNVGIDKSFLVECNMEFQCSRDVLIFSSETGYVFKLEEVRPKRVRPQVTVSHNNNNGVRKTDGSVKSGTPKRISFGEKTNAGNVKQNVNDVKSATSNMSVEKGVSNEEANEILLKTGLLNGWIN